MTLGCKVNQYETQLIRESFPPLLFEEVSEREKADIFIINSCTVTSRSDQKTRKLLRSLKKINPDSYIIVTGCYAERAAEELEALPEVDLVVDNKNKHRIAEELEKRWGEKFTFPSGASQSAADAFHHASISQLAEHTRAFVKIQDGCQSFCSYCIIPYVRGPLSSKPPERVQEEIRHLLQNNIKEIVLVGIHLGQYGRETAGQYNLCSLLQRLLLEDGDFRLRLTSIESTEVSEELLDTMHQSTKIAPHLHIPLQTGEDTVLQNMNRHYTTAEFAHVIERVRAKLTYPAITTDVIVGFPGETDEQFEKTLRFCQKIGFSRMHIFPYADREGTPASRRKDKISEATKKTRVERLMALGVQLQREYWEGFLGKTVTVLVEDEENGLLSGLSEHYVRVLFPGPKAWINTFVRAKIVGIKEDELLAQI